MERHQIIDAMTSLKLYGMRANFDEIAGKGLARRDELYPLLGSLIRAGYRPCLGSTRQRVKIHQRCPVLWSNTSRQTARCPFNR